jgi:predicted ATPase with chaperone activity
MIVSNLPLGCFFPFACMSQLNLSARRYHRVLKLVRTIADPAEYDQIQSVHLTEAFHTVPASFGSTNRS